MPSWLHPNLPSFLAAAFLITLGSTGSASDRRVELDVYGDVLYSHYDYGPDQRTSPTGAPSDSRAVVDIPYFAVELEYEFRTDLSLEIELEYEHGGTGTALELEYEEFGEYEIETEKGGEVVLEQLHLTKRWNEAINLRAGHLIVAVGLINKSHRPTAYFTTVRPEAEVSLIPTTWDETGLELFGRRGPVAYQAQLVNALDSTAFNSKFFVSDAGQGRFEGVRASDLAWAVRFDVSLADGAQVGSSVYRGNTTGNRPKPDMEGTDAHLTVFDVHATLDRGPWKARAVYLRGDLENADLISSKNSRLSSNLQVSRTPVADAALGWYVELGYDIAPLFTKNEEWRLFPFVQYSAYDSMHEVSPGIFDVPRFERNLFTAGLNYVPHPDIVVKADWSHRTFGDDVLNDENTFSLNLAFSTEILGGDPNP